MVLDESTENKSLNRYRSGDEIHTSIERTREKERDKESISSPWIEGFGCKYFFVCSLRISLISSSSATSSLIHFFILILTLTLKLTLVSPIIAMSYQDPIAEHSVVLCEQFNKDPNVILDLARSFGGQNKSLVSAQITEVSQSGFLLSTRDVTGRQFQTKVTSSRSMHSLTQVHDMFATLTTKSSQNTRKVKTLLFLGHASLDHVAQELLY